MNKAKAYVAAAVATLTTFAAPSLDGSFHLWQVAAAAVAGLSTFSATYWVTNTPVK